RPGGCETPRPRRPPPITSARPSPVMVSTPVAGEAGTASCPCATSRLTTLLPTRPLPPITTIFMKFPPVVDDDVKDRPNARRPHPSETPVGPPVCGQRGAVRAL